MILSKHFVYVHMPKTGGTFVRKVMRDHAPADWDFQELDHTLSKDTPKSHEHLPRFGCVRNPFAWYVSWFVYHQKHPYQFFNEISDNGTLGFKEPIIKSTTHPQVVQTGDRIGLYSMMLQNFFGRQGDDVDLIRCENLREEWLNWLTEKEIEIPESMRQAILSDPKVNVSVRDPYTSYYDDELVELILDRERELIARTGYGFVGA